jgi:hypothetical protein
MPMPGVLCARRWWAEPPAWSGLSLRSQRTKGNMPGRPFPGLDKWGRRENAEVSRAAADRTGRSENAVRVKRAKLGIGSACDRRRRENR